MKKIFSGIYEYQVECSVIDVSSFPTNNLTSIEKALCYLRIFQKDTTAIVVLTELATNPGMSVTNAAEPLAEKIIKEFKLTPENTRFIEHYGNESYDYEEGREREDTYDEIFFTWEENTPTQPQWKRIGYTEVNNFIPLLQEEEIKIYDNK